MKLNEIVSQLEQLQLLIERDGSELISSLNQDQSSLGEAKSILEKLAIQARDPKLKIEIGNSNGVTLAFEVLKISLTFIQGSNFNQDSLKFKEVLLTIEQSLRLINNCCAGEKSDKSVPWAEFKDSDVKLLRNSLEILGKEIQNNSDILGETNVVRILTALTSVLFNSTIVFPENFTLFTRNNLIDFEILKIIDFYTKRSIKLTANISESNSDRYAPIDSIEMLAMIVSNIFDNFYDQVNSINDNSSSVVYRDNSSTQPNFNEEFKIKVTYSKKVEAMAHVISYITGEDSNMNSLFTNKELFTYSEPYIKKAINFPGYSSADNAKNILFSEGMAMLLLISFGNLARNESNSEYFSNSSFIQDIATGIINKESTVDIRTLFSALGFIRNLSISAEIKIPEYTLPWAFSNSSHISLVALGVIRHMASSKDVFADSRLPITNLLLKGASIDDSFKLADDFSNKYSAKSLIEMASSTELETIRCESTRALLSVLQTVSLNPKNQVIKFTSLDGEKSPLLRLEGLSGLSLLTVFDNRPQGHSLKILRNLKVEYEKKHDEKDSTVSSSLSIGETEKISLFSTINKVLSNFKNESNSELNNHLLGETGVGGSSEILKKYNINEAIYKQAIDLLRGLEAFLSKHSETVDEKFQAELMELIKLI
ncbi:hypothetical protein AYI69_g562 [Smittium culicis]|uniref:Uncharacterized protein n=1 Tax=Smittium culicis TaxID=133412 RepID=A0A1R1YSP8_9FUNG|nr:hypothetical protein AYI69_g562 [Smittium culicis]